jgi:hypothetical protein
VAVKPHRLPRVPEKAEQQHIVQLLRSLGFAVYVLGTVRPKGDTPGTRQTLGIPDLFAWTAARDGRPSRPLWVEVKARGGRLRPEQAVFREQALAAGTAHIVGGLDAVIAWLVAEGYMRAQHVPHYRLPSADVAGKACCG